MANNPIYVPVVQSSTSGNFSVGGDLAVTGALAVGGTATLSGDIVTASGVHLPPGTAMPDDHGYSEWTGDPENIQGATVLVAGTVYLRKIPIRRIQTPTVLTFSLSVAATLPTAGQSFAGIYSSAGTRLATAGIDTQLALTGPQDVTIAPGQLAVGFVWGAIVANASVLCQPHRMGTVTTPPNANLTAATFRNAVNGTVQTSLPASITPASNSGTGAITMWMALR